MLLAEQFFAAIIVIFVVVNLRRRSGSHRLLDDSLRSSYKETYNKVWLSVDSLYLYREKLIDWHRFELCPADSWKTEGDAQRSILALINSLGDKYSYADININQKAVQKRRFEEGVVKAKRLPRHIGYLKLATFYSANAAQEMEAAMAKMTDARGLILDLRDNGGGCPMEGLQIYSLFTAEGVLKHINGYEDGKPFETELEVTSANCRCGENEDWSRPRMPFLAGDKPLVVLVNEKTASAAEMLAAALRSRPNTLLVGQTTVGKGVSLRVLDFDHGIVAALVHARSTPPVGESYDETGITPEWVVSGRRAQMHYAVTALKNFHEATSPDYALA